MSARGENTKSSGLTSGVFSIAHELGHFALSHRPISFSELFNGDLGRDDRQEREANIFAAELLMPKVALAREAHKFTLEELTRRYMVSMQAMEIRLKELGLVCRSMSGAV